ncbi:Protein nud1 [Teratosphaeriaceae sp. CCFEE 6253]|nr:Protein nud1 [Teratosphaeriaceae sp. CCFEE 6253]
MTAPWLSGLNEAWPATSTVSSATHEAASLPRSSREAPGRSTGGSPPTTTKRARMPPGMHASQEWEARVMRGQVAFGSHLPQDGTRPHLPKKTHGSFMPSTSAPFTSTTSSPVSTRPLTKAMESLRSLGDRTATGPTELEQESLSPVVLQKHQSASGQVTFTARKDSAQSSLPDATDGACDATAGDLSLPEDLPAGTPHHPRIDSRSTTVLQQQPEEPEQPDLSASLEDEAQSTLPDQPIPGIPRIQKPRMTSITTGDYMAEAQAVMDKIRMQEDSDEDLPMHTIETSMGRTLSSNENAGWLPPNVVAHLIGEKVGGMMYDKEKQRWVRVEETEQERQKRKGQKGKSTFLAPPGSECTSDSDPLRELSDLPEQEPVATAKTVLKSASVEDSAEEDDQCDDTVPAATTPLISPKVRGVTRKVTAILVSSQKIPKAASVEDSEDDEVELESPATTSITSPKKRQAGRNLTSIPWRETTRAMSLRRQTLTSKLNGQLRKGSDISIVANLPGQRTVSMLVKVTSPAATNRQPNRFEDLGEEEHTVANGYFDPPYDRDTFLLSDLASFTVYEADEEQPSERILAKRLALNDPDRYALALANTVKVLTDALGSEPFWEDVEHVELQGRSLDSIYGLATFCRKLQQMDVTNNALTQMHGTPESLRSLHASKNQLSSLTYWGHLMNLQYLDVSENKFDSLKGLSNHVHLRKLWANDNPITSLDGIKELNGLLDLSMQRNKIEGVVDFKGSNLRVLQELDLTDNKISEVKHLECLPKLRTLCLDGNVLPHGLHFDQDMPDLETLSVRRCGLKTLNVSHLPNLRYLYIDDNNLSTVIRAEGLKRLEFVSMNRQKLRLGVGITILNDGLETRGLALSGNKLFSLRLLRTHHSLEHLDASAAAVNMLPPAFGQRFPNLRTLNLSHNPLEDVRGLLYMPNLRELDLRENRLDRLRVSVATFEKLERLVSLDLRDNPITKGFYPPAGGVMDDETQTRKGVYERMMANVGSALRVLDGAEFERDAHRKRDACWDRLVELGVVDGGMRE